MTLQIEFWQLLGLLLSGLGALWGVVKHGLGESQRHLDERFALQDATRESHHKALAGRLDGIEAVNREDAAQWQRVERDLLKMQAEMPLHYVRREDYIRGQSVSKPSSTRWAPSWRPPSCVRPQEGVPMQIDHDRLRREGVRWLILLTLNNARPMGAGESLVLSVAQSEYPDATALELRRELDYLHGRELVRVDKQPSGKWRAELTRHGVDVAEYTVDCEPGIARPAKYW